MLVVQEITLAPGFVKTARHKCLRLPVEYPIPLKTI